MKAKEKQRSRAIEISLWQLATIIVAAIACICTTAPLISQYRSSKCDITYLKDTSKRAQSVVPADPHHSRYVRQVTADQCDIIPPMCLSTTTISTGLSTASTTTRRTTVSTVSVTRPVITAPTSSARTTTSNPFANTTRPYNSWRLPAFAAPIAYTLKLSCPTCFELISFPPMIPFNGQVTIRTNILIATNYLVLHAKKLNITRASITNGGSGVAQITYLPEFEMIHLNFAPSTLPVGEITIEIDYTGQINQHDQTGFYREVFWKSIGDLSYLLGGNFEPIHARRAFPCFDEPHLQATFSLTLEHPQNSTIALSNNPTASQDASRTTFETTSDRGTHALAWAILPRDEFQVTTKTISSITVNIWIQPELIGQAGANLDWAFDITTKTLAFVEEYLNISGANFPTKLDLIGVPDLVLDEKASATWGLLTFREEFLSVDLSLNSAERIQSTAKAIAEHVLQIWLSKIDWWNNIWFGKSLASFLAYKMIEKSYPDFRMMEQFPVREMVPLMMDDAKPSIWPVSNKNLTTNEQIIDSLSPTIYSKGAALLRLLEYIVGEGKFQTAVIDAISMNNGMGILGNFYSSLNSETILSTGVTVEVFLRSWLEERNYPIVTVDFSPGNGPSSNTTIIFRQSRYLGSVSLDASALDQDYVWKIYLECQLGGVRDDDRYNLTGNVEASTRKFLLQSATETIELSNSDYLWIKCNKDFYSYQVTEYVAASDDDQHLLWEYFEVLFKENIFSANDKANLLNDAFILPHGGEIVTYDQTVNLVRQMFNPIPNYIPWSVFIWHWNYLMGVEEHSKYFSNFKRFATRQILIPFSSEINNLIAVGASHQERLIRSAIFELLCRVQNSDALNKATELFRQIPASYFSNSTGFTTVPSDYLSTVIYYHLQNANHIDEWDDLLSNMAENDKMTSQQRQTFLRALGASKEIWRLKSLLENGFDTEANLIETQESFDIMISVSQNPIGRDIAWNFYRHYYEDLVARFGSTNRLFNQLITNLAQSFENEFYYVQMTDFIEKYPSPSQNQQLAMDQILMNFEWLIDGLAENLDNAITNADRASSKWNSKQKRSIPQH